MRRGIFVTTVAFVAATISAWAPTSSAAPGQADANGQSQQTAPTATATATAEAEAENARLQVQSQELPPLDVFTATVNSEQAATLAEEGLDIVATQPLGESALQVDAVMSAADAAQLSAKLGTEVAPKRNAEGQTAAEAATLQAANGFDVWRSWDEPGGIRDEIDQIARDNPLLVKREVIGTTYQGRDIVALKVSVGARFLPDGLRPTVLYNSNQHAREWISVEVNRRLLHHFLDGFQQGDREIWKILLTTELYFVLSANPDGYQYTFDTERLWRKNLRDNNEDGVVNLGDGVDPNRNFDEHWNYDGEGSSNLFASDTYRGPAAASEPETQAMQGLIDRIRPRTMSNWHSFANQILYPQGWQIGTPDADNPIYVALGGTDAAPAIPGFDPGVSSDELYVTNGETTDYADVNAGTIAFTPELGEGTPGSGFVFPDDEGLIQAEFANTLNFAMGLARSAHDVDDPASPVGIETADFYLDQAEVDPENGPLSMFDFTFDKSYGDPQEVRVLAKRSLGRITLKYRINGGRARSASTSEWDGGETYGPGDGRYYRVMSGLVTGTKPGDSVEVWFEDADHRQRRSASFTYSAVSETGNDVLIMSAEDYTGISPVYADQSGPNYLSFYEDALAANGVSFDVYDVDANARTAPDPLGVLAHYDAVIWYTGDDINTREPTQAPGTASSLAITEAFAVRDYINEGGRVLWTGKSAGHQYATGHGFLLYDPFENANCADPAITPRCRQLNGSGDFTGDILEYWFGAAIAVEDGGLDQTTGNLADVAGTDGGPFAGMSWGFNGADSAQNQDHSATFLATSGLLSPDEYPQFTSTVAGRYDRPGGPFDPHSGSFYVYSSAADVTYKRLTRTIDVPAGGGDMTFWTSFDTELEWDHFFVEARTPGGDDWTTLPDANGHSTTSVGQSCAANWRSLHPQLDHYQTLDPAVPSCTGTGTTGVWNAASGNSGGWQQWSTDLSAYAGGQVEISLTYASDFAVQGVGVFLDDIVTPTGDGSTDFETDLAGWTVSGAPPGSAPNFTDYSRIEGSGLPEGGVIATDDTLLMGFGFEGIDDAATRNEVMAQALAYLFRDD